MVAGASTVTSTASGTPSSNLRLTVPIAPAISAQQQVSLTLLANYFGSSDEWYVQSIFSGVEVRVDAQILQHADNADDFLEGS